MRPSTIVLLGLALMSAPASRAEAASFTLSRVIDLNTPIPDGTGTFTTFGSFSLSGGRMAFSGSGSSGQQGIYLFDGANLVRVADLTTGIPNGTGTFTSLNLALLSGSSVASVGLGSGQHGLYLFDGMNLGAVADLNTAIPGGTGTFSGFFYLLISDGNVAFRGEGSGQEGEYLFAGGGLSRVADLTTPIPNGSGTFTSFPSPPIPALSGGSLAFFALGSSGQQGIYVFNGSTLGRVADLTTPIPGGSGNFTGFGGPTVLMSGSHVVFLGVGSSGQQGLYLFDGSTLSRIADANTAIPGGTGNFTNFLSPELSGGTVAFIGDGAFGQRGIYLFDGSTLSRAVDTGTALPGGIGHVATISGMALSGSSVAFYAQGSTATQGIYLFDGTNVSTVADQSTAIPNGTGNFSGFAFTPGLDGQNLAFGGFGPPSQVGFYLASPSAATTTTTVPSNPGTTTTTTLPTQVLSYFLPRSIVVKLRGAGKDTLVASGFYDDGGLTVDYTQPVTIDVGGFERTFTLVAKGKGFAFKDTNVKFALVPNLKASSRGKFKMRLAKTTLTGLVDPSAAVEFHFHATGLPDARGTVTLTAGRYHLAKKRGALLVPAFFPANTKAKVGGQDLDSLSFRGGFATNGQTPAQLGSVQFGFGPTFSQTIAGSEFPAPTTGGTFKVSKKNGATKFSISIDFLREVVVVKAKNVELGALSPPTIDIVFDAGAGAGAIRNTVRFATKGPTRAY